MSVDDRPPLPRLRAALLDAARSRPAPRSLGRIRYSPLIAGAGIAAVFIVTLGFIFGPAEVVGADVLVDRDGDHWVVRIRDAAVQPRGVESALKERGIGAHVTAVPVGPSRVGQFVALGGGVVLVGGDSVSSATVRVPVGAPGLRLRLGRAAHPGESYSAPSDAYARGEPLECSGFWGKRVGEVADELPARFPGRIEWRSGDGAGVTDPRPDDVVTDALVHAPDRLLVVLGHEAATPFHTAASRGTPACPVGRDG